MWTVRLEDVRWQGCPKALPPTVLSFNVGTETWAAEEERRAQEDEEGPTGMWEPGYGGLYLYSDFQVLMKVLNSASPMHTHIHTAHLRAAPSLSHTHNLGLPMDTSACRMGEHPSRTLWCIVCWETGKIRSIPWATVAPWRRWVRSGVMY